MNAKENALRIIRFDHPERVVSKPPVHWMQYQGCDHEGFDDNLGDNHPVGSKWIDIWGTQWHKEQSGVMGMVSGCPLANVEGLKSYDWPDPTDERISGRIYRTAESFDGGDVFLGGSHRDTLWEKAYMLVGMEAMMMYFYTEPEFAREVLGRIMDFQLGIAEHYARLGVEIVSMSDDLGTQRGPLLGPKIVNEFFVPEYERLFQFYKERNVLIIFHSCGNIGSVLETFMQLGVDVLNPVQATANNLDMIRAKTQGKMALQGAVSSATVMDGPTDRIAAEAKQRMWQLGREGGYFCRWDQGMPYPEAHTTALQNTIVRYGQYPLISQTENA